MLADLGKLFLRAKQIVEHYQIRRRPRINESGCVGGKV
jgi:hypothetical protein